MNQFDLISPENTEELKQAMSANHGRPVRIIAGGTDVLMELKKSDRDDLLLINLNKLSDQDMCGIRFNDESTEIGALCTISSLIEEKQIGERHPVLMEAASALASVQIRNVATVGGNICTASPSGDVACALMALGAYCRIANVDGSTRTVSINEFFTGLRSTVLGKDEWLQSLSIPFRPVQHIYSGFIKVGTRRSMECSVVSLSYHIESDKNAISYAGLAMGSMAPTIVTAPEASAFLVGKKLPLNEEDGALFVRSSVLNARPIDDIRASAWYRSTVLENLLRGLYKMELKA